MFEAATARPAGESTVARLALTAADYGYDGLVVLNPGNRLAEYNRGAVADEYGIDVVDGVEIVASDPAQASGFLGNHRPKRTIVAVRGGTDAMNRFAVEHPAVDVLTQPFGIAGDDVTGANDDTNTERSRRDAGGSVTVDHVLAKSAAENGVRIAFSFAPLLRDAGGSRVRAIQSLRKLRELVAQYDAPYVITADGASHLGLRAPKDLLALGDVVDFTPDEVRAGLEEWRTLTERNRSRQSEQFVEPGVWRDEDE